MIKSLTLKSFKSFEELKDFDIKPITVLCGANSSGKSSVIKSILTLKQSFESKLSKNSLLFNGKYVNNGNFNNVIHKNEGNIITIKNNFEISKSNTRFAQDSYSYRTLEKMYKKSCVLEGKFNIEYELHIRDSSDLNNKRKKSDNLLDYCAIKVIPVTFSQQKSTLVELYRHKNQEFDYTISWEGIPNQLGGTRIGKIACTCYFSGFQLINIYAQNDSYYDIYDVLPSILSLFQILAQQYSSISYIGPLREAPARRYIYEEEIDEIGVKGENAPYILNNDNYLIKNTLKIKNDDPLEFEISDITYRDHVNHWLKYLGIEDLSFYENGDVLSLLVNGDNIADVGFGVSQALPIIVEGLNINKDQSLILEQPEIHLHPKMQMRLADFLISLALSGKQIIIETHSDHIINRLVRRVMEDKDNNLIDLIKIYFVEQINRQSHIKSIPMDRIKGTTSWPKDFFDQYSDELDKMMKISFSNYLSIKSSENGNKE